jgi:hypothetical protein
MDEEIARANRIPNFDGGPPERAVAIQDLSLVIACLGGPPELPVFPPDIGVQLIRQLRGQVGGLHELEDVREILEPVGGGHTRRDFQLYELGERKNAKPIAVYRDVDRVGKAHRLWLAIPRELSRDEDVDVHPVLGIAQSLAAGKLLDVLPAEMEGLELFEPLPRQE